MKLESCPFCGWEVRQRISNFGVSLMFFDCDKCGATVSFNEPVCNYAASVGDYTPSVMAFNQRAERTCKVRQSYFDSDDELSELMEGIAFSPEDTVVCICDTCKLDWRYDRGIRPKYCPNCGARVVGD